MLFLSGTLFSPFFIISIAQSVLSAILMSLLFKLNKISEKKLFSIYGISVAGSALSAFVQIFCCALYLGAGTFALLGPILIFNTITGFLTAFISEKFFLSSQIDFENFEFELNTTEKSTFAVGQAFLLVLILFGAVSVFFIKNIYVLLFAMILGFALQKICKRKILILPHIWLWIFVFVSSIFVPEGKILFRLWNISITQGALMTFLQKSLRLSTVSALSQCAISVKPPQNTLLALTLLYYRTLSDRFRQAEGSVFQKTKAVLYGKSEKLS